MKDLFGLVNNIKGGWKSSIVGGIFIFIFLVEYLSGVEIELVSIDTAILGLGIILLFARKDTEEEKEKKKE